MEFPFASATDTDKEAPAGKNKQLRVLCLHGFRTSARILQQQLFKKWDNVPLDDLLDLIFTEYVGLEECIQYISDFMYEHGPFDGLLGFSQGAVLCAALAGLQQKGLALKQHPPLHFVLIISGAMFKNIKVKQECYSDIIKCPSLHFIGSKDWLKPKNEELREVFKDPVIIRHAAKHTVPRLDMRAVMVLQSFLRGLQVTRQHHPEEKDRGVQSEKTKSEGSFQEDYLHEIEVAT